MRNNDNDGGRKSNICRGGSGDSDVEGSEDGDGDAKKRRDSVWD